MEIAAPRLAVAPEPPSVRISEFHYDNAGTDAGESVEISAPTGTDLSGWSVVHYNGSNGGVISTTPLPAVPSGSCVSRDVFVIAYGVNGLQNDNEGIALVNDEGGVVEFISYEGVVSATAGPAIGMVARNIKVSEATPPAIGSSMSVNSEGTWTGPAANTFNSCNDVAAPAPALVVASLTISPAAATITQGGTQQFADTARNSSNVRIPGALIGWTSTDPTIATVDANGLVKTLLPGDTKIIAMSVNGFADTASMHVNAAPPPAGLSPIRFTEIHYDDAGTDINEAIEIEGPAGTDLTGWKIVLYNGNGGASYSTQTLSGLIPATCDTRGVITVSYPVNGIQNGNPDGFALINAAGNVVEFLSYGGTLTATDGPALGLLSTDIIASESGSAEGRSLQRTATGSWYGPALNTFGACNPVDPPPPAIFFSGRVPGDPALPVGFQDQLFASLQDAAGTEVPTTITWTTETPAIASIDGDGVFTALAAGTAILRATAATGATGTWSLPTVVGVPSATAQYEGNTEFGDPTDSDPSNDYILRHSQFTSSFNNTRGTPNWVSYNLEETHFGEEDRCDCFTYDPALPASYTRYTTADYTGAGAFHGFGIDRGHFARSFDRTSGNLDNAFTYYFSNIVPQAADQNQGPWAAMETYLGNLALDDNKEVYIIAGVAGNKGTIKNEGLVVIPEWTWKVAVIMPRNQGIENIDDHNDFEIVAAVMPNIAGIRNVNWETYRTTVDSVEALSGYDVLSLLPDHIEVAVESGIANAYDEVDQLLVDGTLSSGQATSLRTKLEVAVASLVRGQTKVGVNQLMSILKELDDLVLNGVVTDAEIADLRTIVTLVIASS